jgi:hypothetical protein
MGQWEIDVKFKMEGDATERKWTSINKTKFDALISKLVKSGANFYIETRMNYYP